jgi:probable HAF family extracellular repeat protein
MRAIRNILTAGVLAMALAAAAGPAAAGTSFEFHDGYFILGMTQDGTVMAGPSMNGSYEAIRWTAETGAVALGMSSGALIGQGGGYTRMSDDGNRICSSTVNADTTLATPGLWTKGVGWQALIPPTPIGGAPGGIDGHLGSPYDVSGDGTTVVGLFWKSTGRGRAFKWTEATGAVDLGGQGADTSARANVTNQDGSVIGGWSADPVTYMWEPTIWEDGVLTVLNDTEVGCDVQCMTPDGNVLGGKLYNPANKIREPTIWFRDGSGWTAQRLGVLPDSAPYDTQALCNGFNAAGTILVGEYLYDISYRTGFVWTLNEGLMTADEFFAGRGVTIPAGFIIGGLEYITPDGNRISGHGFDTTLPNSPMRSFVVTLDTTSDVPQTAAARQLVMGLPSPNPFNPSTSFSLSLAQGGPVNLAVYDIRGALVKVLSDGALTAGDHTFTWDGRNDQGQSVSSGVYLARARSADGETQVRQLTLTK